MSCLLVFTARSQSLYKDSLIRFQQHYVNSHEVVKGDKRKFIHFYPIDPAYHVSASFNPLRNAPWFSLATSGSSKKTFRVYGTVTFAIHDTTVQLELLQSQALGAGYQDYLFLPFTDATTGEGSYESGRYLDLKISDIRSAHIELDFNKAYNPYCAYVSGEYNCPVPPKENRLSIAIPAGEAKYSGAH